MKFKKLTSLIIDRELHTQNLKQIKILKLNLYTFKQNLYRWGNIEWFLE